MLKYYAPMPRKKSKLAKRQEWLKSTEELVKKKPREFIIGFATLLILLIVFIYTTLRFYQQNRTLKTTTQIQKEQITPSQSAEKYYRMQEGESLWDVAGREYGNPYLYPTLVELNNLSSPDNVEPGMKIRIR